VRFLRTWAYCTFHRDFSDLGQTSCWMYVGSKSRGAFQSTKISETEWNGKNSGKSFQKFRNTFWMHPLWRNFRNYRKFCVPFARDVGFSLLTERELTCTFEKQYYSGRPATLRYDSLLATLQRDSSIYLSGKIAGRSDKLPVGIRPVCIISCINNWHVSLIIRKWFSEVPQQIPLTSYFEVTICSS